MADKKDGDLNSYPLQRDFSSSIRLYFQHWMWRRQLGHLLHPSIPTGNDLKIADIACGTGIWLFDLAKELPSADLAGFDISTAQFPSAAWRPNNVTLDTIDILKPVPDALRGKYDVVHVGLLVLVAEKDDPIPILDNLLDLLKPGGYLQWDEADFGGIYCNSPSPDVSHSALKELAEKAQNLLLSTKGTSFGWVRELDKVFLQRELEILDSKFLPIEDDICYPWTMQHLMASAELIKVIEQAHGQAEEWWQLYERAAKEVHSGASMRMDMVSIVGRKQLKIQV